MRINYTKTVRVQLRVRVIISLLARKIYTFSKDCIFCSALNLSKLEFIMAQDCWYCCTTAPWNCDRVGLVTRWSSFVTLSLKAALPTRNQEEEVTSGDALFFFFILFLAADSFKDNLRRLFRPNNPPADVAVKSSIASSACNVPWPDPSTEIEIELVYGSSYILDKPFIFFFLSWTQQLTSGFLVSPDNKLNTWRGSIGEKKK